MVDAAAAADLELNLKQDTYDSNCICMQLAGAGGHQHHGRPLVASAGHKGLFVSRAFSHHILSNQTRVIQTIKKIVLREELLARSSQENIV